MNLCYAAYYLGLNSGCDHLYGNQYAHVEQKYIEHLSEYGISYGTTEEYKFRMNEFAIKEAEYERINSDPENTFTVGHNFMSTWTHEEYLKMLGYKGPQEADQTNVVELDTSNLEASVDWRTKGAVNAVKNQGQCGSCWAFSAVSSMEGHHFIKTGTLLSLAEQQMVDCDTQSQGCNGGW